MKLKRDRERYVEGQEGNGQKQEEWTWTMGKTGRRGEGGGAKGNRIVGQWRRVSMHRAVKHL